MTIMLSSLSYDQRCHLAWRLDHKTAMGLVTATTVARGGWGDMEVWRIFEIAGKSERSAKIHARKVANYSLEEAMRKAQKQEESR